MAFLTGNMKTNFQMLFYQDFDRWQRIFEDLVFLKNPNSWVFITKPYEGNKVASPMSTEEFTRYHLEKNLFESILACLPTAEVQWYKNLATSFDLWDALAQAWKRNNKSKDSDEEVKENLLKKEEEIKVLHSQALVMENERDEMRSRIVQMEERILVSENQQLGLIKLQEDHCLALQTIQDLQQQLSQNSHSTKQPEKVVQPAKVVKKVYASKSSCEQKISQFTNYSLQKNKKYSKKSQSTRTFVHQKVDCLDSVKVKHDHKSVSSNQKKTKEASSKPILPSSESRQTKSCAYTRAQMFALAPSRCHRMVLKQPQGFVPFSQRRTPSQSIPRQQFRSETPRFFSKWNSMSLDYVDTTYRWLSGLSKSVGTTLRWVPKVVST